MYISVVLVVCLVLVGVHSVPLLHNPGSCAPNGTQYVTNKETGPLCICKEGWLGTQCGLLRACEEGGLGRLAGHEACGPHGTCQAHPHYSYLYTCLCQAGWQDNLDNDYPDCEWKSISSSSEDSKGRGAVGCTGSGCFTVKMTPRKSARNNKKRSRRKTHRHIKVDHQGAPVKWESYDSFSSLFHRNPIDVLPNIRTVRSSEAHSDDTHHSSRSEDKPAEVVLLETDIGEPGPGEDPGNITVHASLATAQPPVQEKKKKTKGSHVAVLAISITLIAAFIILVILGCIGKVMFLAKDISYNKDKKQHTKQYKEQEGQMLSQTDPNQENQASKSPKQKQNKSPKHKRMPSPKRSPKHTYKNRYKDKKAKKGNKAEAKPLLK